MIRNGFDVLNEVMEDIRTGKKPERFRLSAPFSHVPLGPGLLNIIAGPTGVGKTALVMQLVGDVLANNPTTTAFVANVEMDPKQLTRRMVARASGIAGTKIDGNDLTRQECRSLCKVASAMKPTMERLTFWDGNFTLCAMLQEVDRLNPDLLVLDYVQRLTVGTDETKGDDERTRLNQLMNLAREFAKRGLCVIILSAVARQHGGKGSNYKGLGLASLRGSSELEYATDNVFVMEADEDDRQRIDMKHEKNRSGPLCNVRLRFNGETYSFVSADIVRGGMNDATKESTTTTKPKQRTQAKKGINAKRSAGT